MKLSPRQNFPLLLASSVLICSFLTTPAWAASPPGKKVKVSDPSTVFPVSSDGGTATCMRVGPETLLSGNAVTKKKKVYFYSYQSALDALDKKLRKAKKPKKIAKAQEAYNSMLAVKTQNDSICQSILVPVDASLKPLSRIPSSAEVRYLLDKAAYGVDPVTAGLVNSGSDSTAIVNALLTLRGEEDGALAQAADRLDEKRGIANVQSSLTFRGQRQAWFQRAIDSNNPFYYRLHECYAGIWTSGVNVLTQNSNKTPIWQEYSNMLFDAGVADTDLPELVLAISRHPMMLFYLNNGDNIKGSPNENFARELMELFTIGTNRLKEEDGFAVLDSSQPNYVEFRTLPDGTPDQASGDVRTVARRLTGFRLTELNDVSGTKQWRGVYSGADHEPGPEMMFSGTPYAFSADSDEDVVRGIFEKHPAAAPYLAHQLIKCFGTERPSLALVNNVGKELKRNGWRVIPTLKTYLASEAFYEERYKKTLTLSPLTLAIKFVRSLVLAPRGRWDAANPNNEFGVNVVSIVDRLYQRLGFSINEPDSVFWYSTEAFVAPGAELNMANLFDSVITDSTSQQRISWAIFDVFPVTTLQGGPAVQLVADRLGISITFDQLGAFAYYLDNDLNSNGSVTNRPFQGRSSASQISKIKTLVTLLSMLPSNAVK